MGSPDSELMFYLALTYGLETNPLQALERTVGLIEKLGHEAGVEHPIQMTVGVSNGVGDDAPLKPMTSLIALPYKVIHDKVSGRVELYDLSADPGEAADLVATRPVLTQQLLQSRLRQEQANVQLNAGAEAADANGEIDPELLVRLCALGYGEC